MRLRGAHIIGQFSFTGAELANDVVPALAADGLQVDDHLYLNDGFRATGRGNDSTILLRGASIKGTLSLMSAELTNKDGPILDLRGTKAESIILFPEVVCPSTLQVGPSVT